MGNPDASVLGPTIKEVKQTCSVENTRRSAEMRFAYGDSIPHSPRPNRYNALSHGEEIPPIGLRYPLSDGDKDARENPAARYAFVHFRDLRCHDFA